MTVPLITQSLATRIGLPSFPPKDLLADWCEFPSEDWPLKQTFFVTTPDPFPVYRASCGPLGGEFCASYDPDFPGVIQGVGAGMVNFFEETYDRLIDLTGKAVSFRVNSMDFVSTSVQSYMTFGIYFANPGGTFFTTAGVVPRTVGSDGYFVVGRSGFFDGDYADITDPAFPPWYRFVFAPDGVNLWCQVSTDCGLWTTILATTMDAPNGFRQSAVVIGFYVRGTETEQPAPVCMSQIFVEDYDPCMIEEES